MINATDLRPGVTFEYDGNLYVCLDYSHNKTARAAANIRVKMKNMRTGTTTEMTFGSNAKVKKAQVEKSKMQYLYDNAGMLVFMDNETYDQVEIPADRLEWEINFMKPSDNVEVTSYEGEILGVALPVNVPFKIIETEAAVKGDTATGATKPAVVETGATVMVPLFVEQDDVIKIDTRTGEYLSRV